MVLDWALDQAEHVARPLVGRLRESPLRSHARYSREELAAALGYASLTRLPGYWKLRRDMPPQVLQEARAVS